MNRTTKIFLSCFTLIIFIPLIYQLIGLYLLVNTIEAPLSETEEQLPDIGIVDN